MPSSGALEPGSGSVTPSLTSNWRAFWAKKKAFSAEIDKTGAATIGLLPPRCRSADRELSLLAAVRDGMGSSCGGEVESKARWAGRPLVGNVKAPGKVPNGKAPALRVPLPRLCRAYAKALALLSNSYAAAVRLAARIKRPARPDQRFSHRPLTKHLAGDCHGPIRTPLWERGPAVAHVPYRQEQPRQLGRQGSKRSLRWPVRRPRRSSQVRHVRERQPAAGRDHGPGNSPTRHRPHGARQRPIRIARRNPAFTRRLAISARRRDLESRMRSGHGWDRTSRFAARRL